MPTRQLWWWTAQTSGDAAVTRVVLGPIGDDPLVTIVIPAYQATGHVCDAIDSVVASSHPRWQCVVVDDSSTDGTAAIIAARAASDPRIELVRKATNGGPLSCLSAAAPHVRGDIVCLLDADDRIMATKLAAVVAGFRRHPGCGLLVHRLVVCDARLRPVGISPTGRTLPEGDQSAVVLRTRQGVPGLGVSSGFCMRAAVFASLFPAGFSARRFPDEYVRRCAPLVTDVCAIDRVLGVRRIHGGNLTAGTRSLDESRAQSMQDHAALSTALTSFATEHGYGERLAPESEDVALLFQTWLARRLVGDDHTWRAAWRSLNRARGYRDVPWPVRAYWRAACFAPLPVFRWMMTVWARSDRLRILVNYLAAVRRRPSVDLGIPAHASFPAALRLAVGR